jgi:cytochrome c biogenesis protein CcmG/thiol:disulfide interchange protein DsbE
MAGKLAAPDGDIPPSRWMRRKSVRIGLALTALGVIAGSIIAALTFSSPAPNVPLLDLPVPRFSLPGLAPGQAGVSSADLRNGGATVVNFWGSWCPPCVEEMPALQAVHHQLGSQVRFVGIDEEDTRPAALGFLRQVGVTYGSGFDGNGSVATAFRIGGTPTTYFISHGKMLDFHQGRMTKGQLLTYIRQIFGVS